MLRVLVDHLLEDLFCERLAVPFHQAQSAAHGAMDGKIGALLDSALFRVGLGLSVFSKDFKRARRRCRLEVTRIGSKVCFILEAPCLGD